MLLYKIEEPEIDSKGPWADDVLKRDSFSKKLTKIVTSTKQPFSIALNSPFGTGKTFFVKRWLEDLKKEKYKTIYLNAWSSDFSEDPLPLLVMALQQQLLDSSAKGKRVLAAAKSLLGKTALNAVEASTAGVVKSEDITKAVNPDSILAQFQEYKEAISKLKIRLENFANTVETQPIIVVIDELDRCRPSYAVALLETIKHVFGASGYVFVFAIDMEQLQYAVGTLYGSGMDKEGYLRRFIDWQVDLPTIPGKEFTRNLYDKFNLSEVLKENRDLLEDGGDVFRIYFNLALEVFKPSLREQHQIFSHLNLIIRLNEDGLIFPGLLGFMGVFRVKDPQKYKEYLECDLKQAYAILKDFLPKPDPSYSDASKLFYQLIFAKIKDPGLVEVILNGYQKLIDTNKISRKEFETAAAIYNRAGELYNALVAKHNFYYNREVAVRVEEMLSALQ